METSSIVRLFVGNAASGRPVFEEVRVRPIGENKYLALQSPGLVLGLAADDVFLMTDAGHFEVLKRGMNLCVQVFSKTMTDRIEIRVTPLITGMGGRLDGRSHKELVYTVPITAGFKSVEAALAQCADQFDDFEWFYGNVYDPRDGVTPLDWWR
jgi:hypothetical protein